MDTLSLLHLFARGGGGGSGGGGGGGDIFVVLGYLPAHFYGAWLRRHMKNPIGLTLMIVGTALYGMAWWFLGSFGIIVSLLAFVGGPAGYFGWFGKVSARIRRRAKKHIATAASQDPAWNEAALTETVTATFMRFQQDWSTNSGQNFSAYMTPTFAYHNQLILHALILRQRRNEVRNPRIIEVFPTDVVDSVDDSKDTVVFCIHAVADDVLIETIDGVDTELFQDSKDFQEFWQFMRSGNGWLLNRIDQDTANAAMDVSAVTDFAATNKLYYQEDWGWLLLPRRGQLFADGTFGKSDINNHVVGVYNQQLLIELYTYVPKPNADQTKQNQYVIAQTALPKRYDSLIVEAKPKGWRGFLPRRTPSGYNYLRLEWPDFNRRYRVFATNVEQVTAFELLHPVFMEKLFALPFAVSIEVVDNVVYLYTKDKNADYATMYAILQDAFKEMKM